MALPPESHRLHPDHLPTPFSADQIRDACPTGRFIVVRTEQPGAATTYRQIRYLQTDADGATQAFTPTDADGMPIGPAVERRSTWLELQEHASKPADQTTCDDALLDTPWGSEACWRYVVREGEGETRFWFAKRLAGMPVLVESWERGVAVGRSEIVATSAVGSD